MEGEGGLRVRRTVEADGERTSPSKRSLGRDACSECAAAASAAAVNGLMIPGTERLKLKENTIAGGDRESGDTEEAQRTSVGNDECAELAAKSVHNRKAQPYSVITRRAGGGRSGRCRPALIASYPPAAPGLGQTDRDAKWR